ncbi:enolase superfamily member 1 [Heterostelium album PN500]|uniref:Enolase superfamily member 1 n=1 Tax=Heterostelium pallidum (strain ATCC 26659 / Pp 5 / PN500) TaxID=670386 RepID=D3AY66_HETP5|nr:enolase superfamily member 1 [Heterostelium album PN500]EFA85893.1 enolase superfamily member 1 [Heterostelium album PN500]|eukprot:XP_020437999.1 enolase superfamily member 1 [Heterostelium album PN500]
MQSFTNVKISEIQVFDVRVPTALYQIGSDAMHTNPDYSCAYVVVKTDNPTLEGYGLTFTLGKGTDVVVQCVKTQSELVIGKTIKEIFDDYPSFYRLLTSEPQLRWIGPEKGVVHLSTAAIVNAIWDLYCKCNDKPLWKLITDMTPETLVGLIDFRYLSDALTKEEALAMLKALEPTKQKREREMLEKGFPAYTTSAGWLGYSDEKISRLCKEALEEGFTHIKIKVGQDINDDIRRCKLIREIIGPNRRLMVDANQRWDVPQAIEYVPHLVELYINKAEIKNSHYQCPSSPGYGCGLTKEAIQEYEYPNGSYWRKLQKH